MHLRGRRITIFCKPELGWIKFCGSKSFSGGPGASRFPLSALSSQGSRAALFLPAARQLFCRVVVGNVAGQAKPKNESFDS